LRYGDLPTSDQRNSPISMGEGGVGAWVYEPTAFSSD
jgi:hypothetical protein